MDHEGKKYGNLTILYRGLDKKRLNHLGHEKTVTTWDCKCDCGNIHRGAVMKLIRQSRRFRMCDTCSGKYVKNAKEKHGIVFSHKLEYEYDIF